MMRIVFRGWPARLDGSRISFDGNLAVANDVTNSHIEAYLNAHFEYWPDGALGAVEALRELGPVTILEHQPPETKPGVVY